MGEALLKLGCAAVLVKGGHGDQPEVEDLLMHQSSAEVQRFIHPRRPLHIHGTGCTLSAAITAALAQGLDLPDAVAAAIEWLHALIHQAHAPLRGELAMLPVASGPAPHFKR